MTNRRSFLQASLALGVGALAARTAPVAAAQDSGLPGNIIFTSANPGIWAGKEGSHAPQVTVEGRKVGVFTKHGMSEEHFIVRHTLVAADGTMLGARTFSPSEEEARSEHELPEGYSGKLYATSFCNKHDMWLTEFAV